ncbi:receptor activity-modifying protein 1-like, partial [Brachionichthys hirsutus]|uniref:receptor activity-modifying protein 1-like n=1 Tax=Brachionichthys hirsutus TaxID=412623 RepID=UPI003604C388
EDVFSIAAVDLGILKKLRIRHNNSRAGAGWFLDRVEIVDSKDDATLYGELTNCTYLVALKMECFWPNRLVDEFFIRVHKHYFHDCSLSGRLLRDPPNRILGPFIAVPILVTLLMTALVVWRSKRSEGIV